MRTFVAFLIIVAIIGIYIFFFANKAVDPLKKIDTEIWN